jgi:hypothetical protein
MTQAPRYTDEVQRALRERAIDARDSPSLPEIPEGHVQYMVAVNEQQSAGVAPPAVVAAMLRGIADQLESQPT